jgi:hypothetical protein
MFRPPFIVLIVGACLLFSGLLNAEEIEFKHSKTAKTLLEKYHMAVNKEKDSAAKQIQAIEAKRDFRLAELRDILANELKKVQVEETKNGKLDAAVEIRSAVESLTSKLPKNQSAPTKQLDVAKLRQLLCDSVWHNEKGNRPDSVFQLNADGTITASWHKEASIWTVLPDGTVQMILMQNRAVTQMVLDPSLRTANGKKGKLTFRRLK